MVAIQVPEHNSANSSSPAVHQGKYLKSISYTGPAKDVHIEGDAKSGKKIYVDKDMKFADLPPALRKSDWIQAAAADRNYSAADLMEIPAPAKSVIYVAYDPRLSSPEWLTTQFHPTEAELIVDGRPMKVFAHPVAKEESLTLGGNTDDAKADACNMYIVFVNGAAAQ
jgi:hypothetical protein